ncbi:MAG: PEP-CTERM system TPR-repeat protein PrsT [Burkholderiaceae bacterium]|nr:PEP-CTERM system TPR-repeat protein PrsT [Burkholderiaceae bacterium]
MTLSAVVGSRPALCLVLAIVLSACSKSPEQLMTAAQRHIAENNPAAAQIELRNVIQAAPNHGLAHRLLGTLQLSQGDPAAAEVTLRKALALAQKPDDVLPALAAAMLRQGQAQKVIDEFGNTTLQDAKSNAALRASVGQAWLLRAEVKPAAEAFAAALAAQPGQSMALLGQARIAAHEGKLDDAMALTDSALKNDPLLADAHVFKSQLLTASDQRPAAVESLEKALAVEAAHVPARLALASMLIDAKDLDKAKTVLGAAGPASKDPRLMFLQALLAYRQNDLPKAKDTVAAVLKAAPEYGPALVLAGEAELRSGNHTLAEQHLGKAMRLQATPGVRRLLAAAQLRQDRPGKALETLQPLLQEAGSKDSALAMLAGEAYLAHGDVRRAGEYFEAAKTAGGNEALARTRLGQLALRRGDLDRGEQELIAAAELGGAKTTEPDLLLVSLHLRRQEPAKALAAAQAFIKKQPQNPIGPVLAGTAQAMQRDRVGARQSFDAALKLKPDHVPALRALADLDVVEGKPEDAHKRYDALLAKKPDDDQLLLALASLQERTGRTDEAANTLTKAIAANPKASEPVVALVQHHLRRKNAAAALQVAQDAVRNNPDELNLAMLLGMTQEAAGASKDALRTLSALVLKEPNALAPLLRLAQIQAKQRDFDGAAATLQRAQEKAPQNDAVTRELANMLVQGGKPDQAMKVARELQSRRPESIAGHILEGDLRAHDKKWTEAERGYRAALRIDANATAAAIKIYGALRAGGKQKEAEAFGADWIARHKTDVPMRVLLAEASLRARSYPAAIKHYEDALAISPNQPMVLNNLAWALGQTNDAKAISVAERAAALAPQSADVLDTLGMLHLKSGDPKKGLELLERVRKLQPERLDLRLHYAKGLLRNGRTDEGRAELRELAANKADFAGKAEVAALLAAP